MSEAGPPDVPEGAAVFPLIPPELGVNPLLLAVIHAAVFLSGSDESVVNDAAAEETLHYLATYLQRLRGPALAKVREDLAVLTAFARDEKWPRGLARSVQRFLDDLGVGAEGEA
jgi:hypothetical protein